MLGAPGGRAAGVRAVDATDGAGDDGVDAGVGLGDHVRGGQDVGLEIRGDRGDGSQLGEDGAGDLGALLCAAGLNGSMDVGGLRRNLESCGNGSREGGDEESCGVHGDGLRKGRQEKFFEGRLVWRLYYRYF